MPYAKISNNKRLEASGRRGCIMKKGLWKALVLPFVTPFLIISFSTATAQTGASDVIEEILVTARRRDEALKDVPVSMTAFTSQDIESAGIELPHQAIALTPNVTVVQVQNATNSFVTVRGISQNRNTEPSVATLVDGVLMSNPGQFNQELFDIHQIEILRGPQGAVYGRNAIGGAILISTKAPSDEFEGRVIAGYDNGPGYKLQGVFSGPFGSSDTLKYRAAFSYKDTDGYIDNVFLGEEADPYEDLSARIKLLYQPSDNFSADFRASFSNLDTQALYYQIRSPLPLPPDPLFGFFPHPDPFNESFGHGAGDPDSVNDTSQLVRNNNAGVNERDLTNVSLKLDWHSDAGTFTSITSFDTLEELLTGDAWDFLPKPESAGETWFAILGGIDQNQSQFLDMDTVSQEFRFTSSADKRARWILGAYAIQTDRFISTGAMADTGGGVFPVFYAPRGDFPYDFATDPVNPQITYLADSQDNFAWAVFGEIAYDISDAFELAFSLRYDEDERENTTLTPTAFLPNVPGFPQGSTGEVRKHTWDDLQPRLSLRYIASDSMTWYGSLSRGFRSGGFNQTGVGAVASANGFVGVGDLFDQETAETIEAGFKGIFSGGRVATNLSVFHTRAEGTYFFIFLAANSTQNLGNLLDVEYTGFEFELDANLAEGFNVNFGYGYTDSEITDSLNSSDIGDKAPNVSKYTVNLGAQWARPIGGSNEFFLRGDFQIIGDTAFFDNEQAGTNDRDPVNLLDMRVGVRAPENWAVTLWGRNLLDEEYHTEYSTGGFVFKAQPLTWGLDFTKNF
jgi:iron complex outermembrane receptor protein